AQVAMELQKLLSEEQLRLTVVNRDNHLLFTPMLHEVAASDLDITHIVNPIRKLVHRGSFFCGQVEHIDLERKRVRLSHAAGHHHHELEYDHLVLALGSVTNFFGLPGLEERALTMKSLGDAIALRNRMIELLEEADFECSAAQRHDLLTFLVAGGGFAGVETVSGINDFVREALEFYPHLRNEDIRVVLVHPGPVILPELSPKLGVYAKQQLEKRGVEIRVNTKVTGASEQGVTLSDGTVINATTLIWTAGTAPSPLLSPLGCRKDRGRVAVNEFMEVEGFPGVWALGDCAAVPNRKTGQPHPPTAQHAIRQGRVLARNLVASLRGGEKKPFVFETIGQLASIGRRTGVANILGVNFSGFIAWWLWRTIYLMKLPRFERKLRVALDWTLDIFFSKDLVQFQTFRSGGLSHAENDETVEERPAAMAVQG
ncbi:MAG: NAD(P)/FAD-dependent oxidoreductase, partial [Gemmatimonadales bacterium]